MINIIAALVIVLIVGSALLYISKEKKKGVHCIGCPQAGKCARACAGHMIPAESK